MSTITYGPALDSEIGYRREGLLRDAAATRLARAARRARRTDRHDAAATAGTPAIVTTAPASAAAAQAVEVAEPVTVSSETRVVRAA